MNTGASDSISNARYAFRFDSPLPRWLFGDKHSLAGWFVDLQGEPVFGLRAIRASSFTGRQTFTARRKKDRADIGAAFPHLADAATSGFLLELDLGLGRNLLRFQVKNKDRIWETFATAVVYCWPLKSLRWLRLYNVRRLLIEYLWRRYSRKVSRAGAGHSPEHYNRREGELQASPTRSVELFATSRSNLFILEIAELVAEGFRELGFSAKLRIDEIPSANRADDVLQLVVTPHEYYNLFLLPLVSTKEAQDLSRHLVLLCTEQPETGWFYQNLLWARHARAVADISSLGAAAYRSRHIPSYHFQLGYHPCLAADRSTRYTDRTNDITFLGSMTPRRDAFFAEHTPFFAAHVCHLRFVPLSFAKTDVTRSYLTPVERNRLLSDSRILLNVHYSGQAYFEWHRALVGLANSCCVVSEAAEGYGPLVPGRHFVMADREDLIACCEYYLNHTDECEAIARQGQEFLQKHLRQSASCQSLLDALNGHAEPVSYNDPEPVAHPKKLRRSLRTQHFRRFRSALSNDVCAWPDRFDDVSLQDVKADPATGERELAQTRRLAYRHRWQEQERERQLGHSLWEVCDNKAYSEVPPALSVVITLFNYAEFLEGCVESITQAALCMSEPIEIVIVNDASTDDSLEKALHCHRESHLSVRVVDKKINTGLADARNIGTRLARSPYVFMMDADNLLYPASLRCLWEAIRKGDYVAAYSLLCRFKGTPLHRTGLVSQYDWDPQVLVQYPYIDAMALFRRDALLEVDGYDNELNQIGWFGWEDYDLWLQFAQRGFSVAFVPNILCLYRQHDRSMINTTNLFEMELVSYFSERYAELVAQFESQETLFGVERSRISNTLVTTP